MVYRLITYLRNFCWIIPFISFFLGYFFVKHYYTPVEQDTPAILGMNLAEALTLLSQKKLHLQILSEKIEKEIAPGTILWQTPSPGQKIKSLQTIFCTVAAQAQKKVPQLVSYSQEAIQDLANEHGLRINYYHVPCQLVLPGICFGQDPVSGSIIPDASITVYIAQEQQKNFIVPVFTRHSLQVLQESIMPSTEREIILHAPDNHQCSKCTIVAQQPVAGSYISEVKNVELYIDHVI